jgi:dynein heavy chain
MIVGPAGAGKTAVYNMLAKALTYLRATESRDPAHQSVQFQVLNPKSISMGELFGDYNEFTGDWKDGLASSMMRLYSDMEDPSYKWIVFDGPVDSKWIENMNTVLDDNMMLCLANSERIKLKKQMRMLFEV